MSPFEILSVGLVLLGAFAWLIRLESKANNTADGLREHKEEIKAAHAELKAEHEKNSAAVWNAIRDINNNFNKLFESIGELKGLINRNKE